MTKSGESGVGEGAAATAPLRRSQDDQLQPPEGGWGWMVVLGMALMFIATTAHYGSFGLLFDGVLARLGQQTTGATFVMNALASAVSFTGLVTNHLLRKMSCRMVSVIGALVSTVGLMLTIFADSIGHIVITYSIISGIGLGMVAPASYLAFNTYFLERRGLAMGVCQAGIGLGFIVAPPLVQCLLDQYGYRGTMLVLSGIALNGVVGAVLYQPVSLHMVRRPPACEILDIPSKDNNNAVSLVEDNVITMEVVPDEEDSLKTKNGMGDPNCYIHQLGPRGDAGDERRDSLVMSAMMDRRAHLLLRPVDEDAESRAYDASTPIVAQPAANQRPASAFVANFASNVLMFDNAIAATDAEPDDAGAVVVIRRKRQFSQQFEDDLQGRSLLSRPPRSRDELALSAAETSAVGRPRRWLRAVWDFLDLGLLGDAVYVNIVLGLSVSFLSDANFFTVFPFFLQSPELRFSARDTAVCMSIAAGADVASRLVLPWLTIWLGLRARDTYLLGCLTSAIARSVFACVDGFFSVAIMSCVVGLLKGSMVVNLSLTIAEHCSLDRFAAAYSLYMVINGLITVTVGPLVGVVRDRSGSFPLCIHALSALMLLCVFGWLVEYFVVWYRAHRHNLAHAIKSRLC